MGKLTARFNTVGAQFDLLSSSTYRDPQSIPPVNQDLLDALPLQMPRFPILHTTCSEAPKIHLWAALRIVRRLYNSPIPSRAVLIAFNGPSSTLAQRLNELANSNADGLLG